MLIYFEMGEVPAEPLKGKLTAAAAAASGVAAGCLLVLLLLLLLEYVAR